MGNCNKRTSDKALLWKKKIRTVKRFVCIRSVESYQLSKKFYSTNRYSIIMGGIRRYYVLWLNKKASIYPK